MFPNHIFNFRTDTMKITCFILAFAVCTLSVLAGCSESTPSRNANIKTVPANATSGSGLIAFQGSVPGKQISRSKAEAEKLANEILAKAQAGEDFDALVEKHTDDSPPGIYHMANFEQDADMGNPNDSKRVYQRSGMVGAFGNVGFPLKVGEVGLANYDPAESKYGWHIIKRLK